MTEPAHVVVNEPINVVSVDETTDEVYIVETGPQVLVDLGLMGPPGPPGEQGPRGPAGDSAEALSFLHTQVTPQSVVTITHSLGYRPAGVSLFSLDYGTKYRAFGVQHLDENTLRISMDYPTACVVVMS